MKRTLIGALCLSLLATGCSDQPQQPEVKQKSQPSTSVETPASVAGSEKGVLTQEQMEEALAVQKAIQAHDVKTLRKLLKEGADLMLQPSGNTYATECVLANFPEGLKVLKEFNFDFDMRNERNGAPALLCVAAKGGDFNHLEMARILLECGASVNGYVIKPDDPAINGLTPFYLAMERAMEENNKELFEVARFLLESGAYPDVCPEGDAGQTMLMCAIFEKNLPAVELLLQHGASVTWSWNDGATAVKIAAQSGTPAEIRQAIAAKAKVCNFSIFGITLGQPLPENIASEAWGWGVFGKNEGKWEMPKPFRRFKEVMIERTLYSHRVASIYLRCEVGSELQRAEEVEAIRSAIEQKFDITLSLPAAAFEQDIDIINGKVKVVTKQKEGYEKCPLECYEYGVKITLDPDERGEIELRITVVDKETLELIDSLSAPTVETDLDVL